MIIISPFKRKILKIIAYIFGSIVLLMTAFHFWFINHAESLLEELVASRSNGKIQLQVKKFRFNWFSNDMQLREAVFYSTDTAAATAYRFKVARINVRVKEILPLVFEKRILIDSLGLVNPDIYVTRLKSSKDTNINNDKTASLPKEMGRVYKSIQDALKVLKVTRFRIDGGKFTMINKMQPDELPVTITNIQFHLDNLKIDTSKAIGEQKILFSDNVALQTHNQDIYFPDGRHRLSFSNFRINILKKMVEFDSCTIAASKGDSSRSSFTIFFDKLQLTNIDFDTLYQKEVIKADSVYCINPRFRLDVELGKRSGERKPPPKLNELIQQLTGDLKLEFVVVKNGSFDINTLREGNPSSFTSNNNNFEMQGLRIQKNSPQPFTVRSFAMAIRNYENFLRDSTYAMQFDSILLINNSIFLSNFSIRQMEGENIVNSFSMPQFELRGLSWDDLVFERKLTAERATLYQPVIDYTVREKKKRGNNKQDVFETLAGIGDIIQLNNLDISNGKINVNFKGGTQLQLENATMSLLSQNLVSSHRISNLQRSVRHLRFRKGQLKMGNLIAQMENVDFTGKDGILKAGTVHVTNRQKNLKVIAKNVVTNRLQIDNNSYITEISGIQWQEADVRITGMEGKKDIAPDFIIRDIRGANTNLTTTWGSQRLSAFFETISADEFLPIRDNKPKIINLNTRGRNLSFTRDALKLNVSHFDFHDHQTSEIGKIIFSNYNSGDSISAIIPLIGFTPDLNAIINGSIIADNVTITKPVIRRSHSIALNTAATDKEKSMPEVIIGKMAILQPDFFLDQPGSTGFSRIEWHSKEGKNNSLELENFRITGQSAISADNLLLSLQHFSFTAGGKTFDAGEGEINTSIDHFSLKPTETGEWDWQGNINDLRAKNFLLDSLGKNAGQLEIKAARLSKLSIGSATLLNFRQLVKENTSFRLQEITGSYKNTRSHFEWENASYDKSTKTFTLDSFSFQPSQNKEDFIAGLKHQADYMTLQTGAVRAGPFDIDRFLADSVIDAGTLTINNIVLADYRDKRLPLKGGIIKPLPVDLLRRIPVHLNIDTITITNADVEYTELNDKTKQAGTIPVKNINAQIISVNNYDHRPGDSLRIKAKADLMNLIPLTLCINESYADTLAGFLMIVHVPSVDAKSLNPVLIPLASVQLESGVVDTLTMLVTGEEYIATGEITLYYHDLKIKLLNNKDGKKGTRKGFASFLANAFVIKKNNTSKKGVIFFERARERSAMHYLVKIVLSGISHSIGLKNNNKALKYYKKRTQ